MQFRDLAGCADTEGSGKDAALAKGDIWRLLCCTTIEKPSPKVFKSYSLEFYILGGSDQYRASGSGSGSAGADKGSI